MGSCELASLASLHACVSRQHCSGRQGPKMRERETVTRVCVFKYLLLFTSEFFFLHLCCKIQERKRENKSVGQNLKNSPQLRSIVLMANS